MILSSPGRMSQAMVGVQRIEVSDPIEIVLPDGMAYKIRPGPYGKGVAVVPLVGRQGAPRGDGRRGRKPRDSTVQLRRKLDEDARKNEVKEPRHYVKWLISQDSDVSLAVARQVVYRERRRTLEATD